MKLSTPLGIWRFFLISMVYLILFIPFFIISKIHNRGAYVIGRLYLRWWHLVIGHRVIIRGTPSQDKPTLFCSNHISYIDILMVGPYVHGRFIAKSEVKKWPLFGYLSTMHGSVYVDRSKTGTAKGIQTLNEELDKGYNFILFPEGTTSDGCRVLPFASSYFDIAMKKDLTVQPITLAYAGWDGMPMPRYLRKAVGWFSPEMEMLPHLWQILRLGKVQGVLTFHPPLKASDFKSRKELAKKCWEMVNQGLFDSFSTPLHGKAA